MLLGFILFFAPTLWLSFTLAQLGLFTAWIPLTGGLFCWALARMKRPGRLHSSIKLADIVMGTLAVCTLVFTLPAGELILGGWDPGVYLHTSVQIAEHGSLQFQHADLASTSPAERALLARNPDAVVEPFSGVRLLPNGALSPQFYHAYPSLLALFVALFGLAGALWVNPLLNVAAVLTFYALLSEWTNRRWALIGAMILAFNPAQLWMAKFSTAELLTQVLVLAGFTLLYRWHRQPKDHQLEAFAGGVALGLAQLTRYDTLILLAAAVPILLLVPHTAQHRRGLLITLAALGLAAVHAWVHQRWVAPYYRPLGPTVTKGLALCAGLTLIILMTKRLRLYDRLCARLHAPLCIVAMLGWSSWMLFNWQIRPKLHANSNMMSALNELLAPLNLQAVLPTLTGPPSRAMLYLESIFSPYGLALALAGTTATLWYARKDKAMQPWFWGGLAVTLLLTWNPFNDLFMMWVSRRYIPVVIPWLVAGAIIGSFHACRQLTKRWPFRFWEAALPLILLLALVLPVLPSSGFLAKHRDWPGLIAWYEELDQLIPQGSSIYTDQPGFGAPLRFVWGHNAFELHRPTANRRTQLAALLNQHAQEKGPVYLLTTRPPEASLLPDTTMTLEADLPLKTHIIQNEKTRLPRTLRPRGGAFQLHKISAKDD